MKLSKIALGVTLGIGGLAANAADVVMFPYIVTSDSVASVVSIIDAGASSTSRYDASGKVGKLDGGATFNRLHWRLNYKAGDNATKNDAACQELDFYLPSSPNDIQTVDLGGHLSDSKNSGVMFNDPSVNNTWKSSIGSLTYAMAAQAGNPVRGMLFVHNADNVANSGTSQSTVQGEAMIFEFSSGAAWGYTGIAKDGGNVNDYSNFDFSDMTSTSGYSGKEGWVPGSRITFMPPSEVTTKLFVTPLNDSTLFRDTGTSGVGGVAMLGVNGSSTIPVDSNGGFQSIWDKLTTNVGLKTGSGGSGVAYDRDENLVSGSIDVPVTCVGAVDVMSLMTTGAQTQLADGGYGMLRLYATTNSSGKYTAEKTRNAVVIKLEYSASEGGKFVKTLNGHTVGSPFNNAFILP